MSFNLPHRCRYVYEISICHGFWQARSQLSQLLTCWRATSTTILLLRTGFPTEHKAGRLETGYLRIMLPRRDSLYSVKQPWYYRLSVFTINPSRVFCENAMCVTGFNGKTHSPLADDRSVVDTTSASTRQAIAILRGNTAGKERKKEF